MACTCREASRVVLIPFVQPAESIAADDTALLQQMVHAGGAAPLFISLGKAFEEGTEERTALASKIADIFNAHNVQLDSRVIDVFHN